MVEAGDKILVFKSADGKFWLEESATPEAGEYGLLTNIDGKNIFLTKSSLNVGDYCRIFKIEDKYIARGIAEEAEEVCIEIDGDYPIDISGPHAIPNVAD